MAGKKALMTTQPQRRARTNDESVRQMMRALTKRARVVRVMVTTMRVACNKEGVCVCFVMAIAAGVMATKVLCNEKGGGNGGKSDGDKGGGQAMGTVTTWAMAMATRLVGNKEGKCKGSRGNGNGNEGGRRWQQRLKQGQRWQRQ